MDDGVVNWGEHTVEEEESNHALMAISSNNEVSLCSKTCIDSYNKLKTLCDEQTNQLGEQEAKILAYTLAVKKLEAQVVTFQKQQLSLNEQLTFQANEIYAKDEKLKKYRRIGMKAVKEKEQLQKIVDSWKNSSKNLWKLVDSGMTSTSKIGLGYEIQSNNEVLSYEEEMNHSVFKCTKEDYVGKPLYSRFSKTDNFKGGPQKPKISDSADNSTEHSTCQSNDSEGSFGNPSKHSSESESESISVPNEMSTSKSVTANKKVLSESKEVKPSCVTHVKTPRKQMKNQETHEVKRKKWNEMMGRKLGEGYSFIKKKCFVCGSLSHLFKDCDYYAKKMAREAELKKQRVFNTVQLNFVRPNINTGRVNVNYVKFNVNSVRHNVNSVRTNVNTGRSKQPVPTCNSNNFSPVRPQGAWGTAIKTSAGYNWRRPRPNSNYNSGSNFVRTDHPLKNMEERGIFNSGCSGHMTGNKDHLDDFEEYKGGFVTFGGSKCYITGKGRIKVSNLEFDNVSFVKELGHFNLFSISQICDKHHKVLFTKTECLVVSPDFKMPDANQILLKVVTPHKFPKDKKDIMLVQVYVDDIIFGSTRKSWCDEFEALMKGRFIKLSSMGELIFFLGLQVKQKTDGLFISQDKYVADMLKKFDLASVKTAITPMDTQEGVDTKMMKLMMLDVHFYITNDSFSDSDYAGANIDRKSTTGGCQFLRRRLISWQCKKQTIVATSIAEAEYVAAVSYYGQVLWIQNQMLDYGFNFMNTKIHIDNESTICIVKNLVYHSKTKHIEIRHHFIRDSYEKKLIRVEKIHTDFNVADLLTKAFDGPRFNFLVVNIGMINP
ncbi:putative ribonuclease H-like domain-containing protein [Tanacetum coccineum]